MELAVVSKSPAEEIIPPKDFQCPICLKFFSRKFTLEMHMLIHQGLKPHTCPYCGKSFRQKGTLMRHKVRHEVAPGKMEWRNDAADAPSADGSSSSLSVIQAFSSQQDAFPPSVRSSERNSLMIKLAEGIKDKAAHHREFLAPPPLTPGGRPPQNNHLGTLPQLTLSPYASTSPKGGGTVKWHCNVCPFETPFDYGVCNAHLLTHEHQFQHKCFLCLRLFATAPEYNQHIEQFHGDNKVEDILAFSGANSSSSSHGSSKYGGIKKENHDVKKPSAPPTALPLSEKLNLPTVNSGELTIKPISAPVTQPGDSGPSAQVPEKSRTTLTCIPCQADFASEEDFECHVKTHVQSVLVVDSDSENSYEALRVHNSSSRPLHQEGEILSHVLNGSLEGKGSGHQPIVMDTRIPSLLSGGMLIKPDQFSKELVNSFKENFHHRRPSPYPTASSAPKRARTHPSGYTPYYDHHSQSLPRPPGVKSLPNNFVTSDSLLKLEKLRQNISTKFLPDTKSEGSSATSVNSGVPQDNKVSGISSGQQPSTSQPPTQVFLCPFCKKYFSSAKILCRHAKRHLQDYKQPQKEKGSGGEFSEISQQLSSEVVKMASSSGEEDGVDIPREREENCPKNEIKSEGEEASDEDASEAKPNIDSIYDYEAPLVCEECNVEFRKKCLYAYHLQLHMRVKAYSCWICHRSFRQKSLLLRHTLALHMKTFSCPNCHRQFRYRSLYKFHMGHCSQDLSSSALLDSSSLCVPIIDLKQILEGRDGGGLSPNIVGVIPIGPAKQALGIPVMSPAHFSSFTSLPLTGKIPICGKVELASSSS